MSSLVIKIGSLFIKTLSKPIANKIKQQAREHDRFRRVCITIAQGIHRYDMRFRLGLLQDQSAIERQIAREAAEAQTKRQKTEIPTVKTESQTKREHLEATNDQLKPKKRVLPRIKPLSEAKAIDSGANFVSETFLLLVAIGTIFGERYYSSRKESTRREGVTGRLEELETYEKSARKGMVELEREVLRLRSAAKVGSAPVRILPPEVYELEAEEERANQKMTRGNADKSTALNPANASGS